MIPLRSLIRTNIIPSGTHFHTSALLENCYRSCLGKLQRKRYLRVYNVELMRPDGSTIPTRFHEPRAIIQLPIDLRVASADERRQRLALRKPQATISKKDDVQDNFKVDSYRKMFKKR